ncbi:spike base protein, RCAP_Rcc01079 family [Mangrovicoccus ximenensis]|uniref:spike base protein, RCAP_Rcc01079 family n=1 Tax=Mangrovicoccus ximenensis TaxID=1911570 RepID=UPI0011AE3924|nr:hypothetical protein [Mangrovicoccus ximenensis]
MARRIDGAVNGAAVLPSDAPLPAVTRGIMVAVGGNLDVLFAGTEEVPGNRAVLPALQPGVVYAVQCERIYPEGTTAAGIVILW